MFVSPVGAVREPPLLSDSLSFLTPGRGARPGALKISLDNSSNDEYLEVEAPNPNKFWPEIVKFLY